jgi:antitoxin component YwqK of YwqJK toxin-antitoxin module
MVTWTHGKAILKNARQRERAEETCFHIFKIRSTSRATMNMLHKLHTVLFAEIFQFCTRTEVSELRALDRRLKDIISMNRQLFFTKCFHVLPHGVVETIMPPGNQVQVSTFKEGIKHGEERLFWLALAFSPHSMQRKLSRVTIFKDGQKHGDEKHFKLMWDDRDPPVQERTTPFIEGQKHGLEKRFYLQRNKMMLVTTQFKEGQKHGVEKYFHQYEEGVQGEEGVLVQATSYKEGQLHGEERKWNIDGVLKEMTTFNEGQQVCFWREGIESDVHEHNIIQYKRRKL